MQQKERKNIRPKFYTTLCTIRKDSFPHFRYINGRGQFDACHAQQRVFLGRNLIILDKVISIVTGDTINMGDFVSEFDSIKLAGVFK